MSVVAITGCSGYLGSRLLPHLAGDSEVSRIIGIDIKPAHNPPDKLELRRMDVRDSSLGELFEREKVEKVIHFAFVVNPIRDDIEMHDIDVNGTRNVLSAVATCSARHVTIASSTTAFGAHPDNPEWLTEEDPPRQHPGYTYASDKYEVETMAREFKESHPEVKVAVVRPCIVYGPNVDNYLSRFLFDLPVFPCVDGARPEMQLVHEDDAADVFMRVIDAEAEGFFHAVGNGTLNVSEVARIAGRRVVDFPARLIYPAIDFLWNIRFPRISAPSGMLDFIRYRWTASDDMTRERLDLGPHRPTEEVLRLMLRTHGRPPRD